MDLLTRYISLLTEYMGIPLALVLVHGIGTWYWVSYWDLRSLAWLSCLALPWLGLACLSAWLVLLLLSSNNNGGVKLRPARRRRAGCCCGCCRCDKPSRAEPRRATVSQASQAKARIRTTTRMACHDPVAGFCRTFLKFLSNFCRTGSCLGSVWVMFGVTLGRVWGHFGSCLGSSGDMFGSCLGSLWGVFGSCLGSLWGMFGVTLGRVWGHPGSSLGHFLGRVGGPFWATSDNYLT